MDASWASCSILPFQEKDKPMTKFVDGFFLLFLMFFLPVKMVKSEDMYVYIIYISSVSYRVNREKKNKNC